MTKCKVGDKVRVTNFVGVYNREMVQSDMRPFIGKVCKVDRVVVKAGWEQIYLTHPTLGDTPCYMRPDEVELVGHTHEVDVVLAHVDLFNMGLVEKLPDATAAWDEVILLRAKLRAAERKLDALKKVMED